MSTSAVGKGHVNFGRDDKTCSKENSIILKQISPGRLQAHLGFLQYHHIYKVVMEFPKYYFLGHTLKSILDAAENSTVNMNCKILSIEEKSDNYELVVEFFARKERLLQEEITFIFKNDEHVMIELIARVLGPGKGTPLLKNGIKCVGIDLEELSDVSDWQAD